MYLWLSLVEPPPTPRAGVSLPGFVVIGPRLLAGTFFPGEHDTGCYDHQGCGAVSVAAAFRV